MTDWNVQHYFTCPVYTIDKPEFLTSVKHVSDEYLDKIRNEKELDEIYPVHMTYSYNEDPRIEEFGQFVADSAATILDSQGYNMDNIVMRFSSMWTQEHHKHSAMEQHVHGNSQIVGFYFLDVPENSSLVLLHDPRAGKIVMDLPERNPSMATTASQIINIEPRPGKLILTNSWLAHSFTRHRSNKTLSFVHFNLYSEVIQTQNPEVIII